MATVIWNNPNKIVYIGMNKNATTNIHRTTGTHWKSNKMKGIFGVPISSDAYTQFQPLSYYKKLYPKHYFFTFVRNPYDRHLSHFLFKQRHNPEHYQNFEDFTIDVTVPDFKPQSFFIDRPCDFIGRFENLEEDFQKLCDHLNVEFKGLYNRGARNATGHTHYRDYYNKRTKEMVTEAYKADLENFGYAF
jgi:hypothetical protein